MKKIAVMLSGCGVKDGSEIHEAVLTLLFLDQSGAEAVCIAPDMDQCQVINHITGQSTAEKRNVLTESARIARGNIQSIKNISAASVDGLILPGGFGAVCNLSDFSTQGAQAKVNPDVRAFIQEMAALQKPIGALCIAPATLACVLKDKNPSVTVGNDVSVAKAIEAIGGHHQNCTVQEIHFDPVNKLVTTPAYMLGPGIKDIAVGIEKLVNKILEVA